MPDKRPIPRITIPRLREWNACYHDEDLAAVFGKRKAFTPFEICELNIPPKDKLWVLLRPEIIPPDQLYALAAKLTLALLNADSDRGHGARRARADAVMLAHREWRRGKLTDKELDERRTKYWRASAAAQDTVNRWYFCDAVYTSASRCPLTAAYYVCSDLRGALGDGVVAAADALSVKHLKLVRNLLVRLYGEPKPLKVKVKQGS